MESSSSGGKKPFTGQQEYDAAKLVALARHLPPHEVRQIVHC
jgi:hypothetical protein